MQFVSLCYYEYLSERLRQLKQTLAAETGSEEDTAQVRKNKKKLLFWLNNTPVYLTLQWFDAVEEVKVSARLIYDCANAGSVGETVERDPAKP